MKKLGIFVYIILLLLSVSCKKSSPYADREGELNFNLEDIKDEIFIKNYDLNIIGDVTADIVEETTEEVIVKDYIYSKDDLALISFFKDYDLDLSYDINHNTLTIADISSDESQAVFNYSYLMNILKKYYENPEITKYYDIRYITSFDFLNFDLSGDLWETLQNLKKGSNLEMRNMLQNRLKN